jgi:hypothetical protein
LLDYQDLDVRVAVGQYFNCRLHRSAATVDYGMQQETGPAGGVLPGKWS